MSYIKPEIHNISQHYQRKTSATGNTHKKLAKFGHVVFELCEQRDRQTDILITILCILARNEVITQLTELPDLLVFDIMLLHKAFAGAATG